MLVVFGYLSVVLALLWLVGINVQRYIFHDTIFTVALIVFGTILIYNAFKEFTDAFVDKSNPIDHEKILTFMPIIIQTGKSRISTTLMRMSWEPISKATFMAEAKRLMSRVTPKSTSVP